MVKRVILDVDTGSDDAVALLTAIMHEKTELIAACTVAGNLPLDNTTENTLRVLEAAGCSAPVYRGCAGPMVKNIVGNRLPLPPWNPVDKDGKPLAIHSEYLDLPASKRSAEEMPAPAFYVDYLRKAEQPVTIVAVGPLSNLGVALAMDPDVFKKNVEQIVIMGGGHRITNVTPCAEANIWNDPEAAQLVAHCGAKVVFVPLDATHRALITKEDCKRLRALGTFAGDFAARLCEQRIAVHNANDPLEIPDSAPVHDALAVAYVIDPSVLRDVRRVNLNIGLGDFAEGCTIVDGRRRDNEKNCLFAFDGDRFKFVQILCEAFGR